METITHHQVDRGTLSLEGKNTVMPNLVKSVPARLEVCGFYPQFS